MKETLKYIEVLNWGYSGFAPMTLGQDFEKSLQQVQERLALLDGLDYGALLVEATSPNGKANLLKYQSTEDSIEYSLHFMRDRQILLDTIPTMFKCFMDGADKFKVDGLWTDEQWREYRVTLSQVERGFELRLKQFATAYDYPLSNDPNSPEPQQIPQELATQEAKTYFDKAIELGLMDNYYNWLKGLQMLACFAREMSLKLDLGKGVNTDGMPRISWKPFETLFSVDRGKLRLNYNDIQKTGQQPKEVYLIDKVFE